ncbi:hypothetical protein TELCIR_07278 [Teladorsagia circumcincta]|uniref:Uncharacterized protein n=1 Tax=Teladorsagia circumcincta TaxID=45464 RepID=A0A2G9UKT1_TELCI|nr:hypothetical protein TELCIR_07278 [Teladorsagia circumcincta]
MSLKVRSLAESHTAQTKEAIPRFIMRSVPDIWKQAHLKGSCTSQMIAPLHHHKVKAKRSFCRGISSSPSPSPPTSFRVPDLHIEHNGSELESPPCSEPEAKVDKSPELEESVRSYANVASQANTSGSDLSTMARESAGMLEQVFHELFTIKRRNSVLEKMASQSNEWRTATEQLEKETKMLHRNLKSSRNREEKLEEEVKQLCEEKEELMTKLSSQKLLKKQRHCKDLEEQLSIMNELVEKLEVERAAEYQRRLEETSKRITDDMSADIALARKERELEHERLIEAYREKMLLYDDLTRLRKERELEHERLIEAYREKCFYMTILLDYAKRSHRNGRNLHRGSTSTFSSRIYGIARR